MEIWKDVKDFEGYYQISNYGRVRSLDRYARIGNGGYRLVKGKMLRHYYCPGGYQQVNLARRQTATPKLIHRLVAEAFIPNPNNYPQVNHKDENKSNNHYANLEWCTPAYNANYGTRNERSRANRKTKAVNQYDVNGNFIKRGGCISDACRETGADVSAIIRVCQGRQITALGYVWEYAV